LLLSGDLSPFIGERERLRLLLCLLPDRERDLSPLERSRLDLSLKGGGTFKEFSICVIVREILFSCANYVSIKEKASERTHFEGDLALDLDCDLDFDLSALDLERDLDLDFDLDFDFERSLDLQNYSSK